MESANTSKASSKETHQDQSSRQRRKLTFTITFFVVFSLIIGSIITVLSILKHQIEVEDGLSANPSRAIRAVCSLADPYSRRWCFRSLSHSLNNHPSETMNPSKIFTLSLRAAIEEVKDLISTTQTAISGAQNSRTLSALRDCKSLFEDSMRLLNQAIKEMDQIDPEENVFKVDKPLIRTLQAWMTNATENFDRCSNGTEYNTSTSGYNEMRLMRNMKTKVDRFSRPSVENSLTILVRMDEILELFDPHFGSVLAEFLASIYGFVTGLVVFCSQYVVLGILIFLVLRL